MWCFCVSMRSFLGVQSVYEDVARDTNRGHTVKAVCENFNLAKDTGYKVVTHMMPDLPNVDLERDVEQFIVRFKNLVCAHAIVILYHFIRNFSKIQRLEQTA